MSASNQPVSTPVPALNQPLNVASLPHQTPTSATPAVSQSETASSSSVSTPSRSPANRFLDLPALRFLLRPDFFNLLHLNDDAFTQYNGSSQLKHIVTKIRNEGKQNPVVTQSFERYQHNRDLVSLINKFSESNRPLPQGKSLLCFHPKFTIVQQVGISNVIVLVSCTSLITQPGVQLTSILVCLW